MEGISPIQEFISLFRNLQFGRYAGRILMLIMTQHAHGWSAVKITKRNFRRLYRNLEPNDICGIKF